MIDEIKKPLRANEFSEWYGENLTFMCVATKFGYVYVVKTTGDPSNTSFSFIKNGQKHIRNHKKGYRREVIFRIAKSMAKEITEATNNEALED